MLRVQRIDFLETSNCYGDLPVMRLHLRGDIDLEAAQPANVIAAAQQRMPELASALDTEDRDISATRLVVLVALALQNRHGFAVSIGMCRHEAHHSLNTAHAVAQFEHKSVARRAAHLAVRLVNSLLSDTGYAAYNTELQEFDTFGLARCPTPTQRALTNAATARRIPHAFVDRRADCIRLGEGHHRQLLLGILTERSATVDEVLARDQLLTLRTLKVHGLPTVTVLTPADTVAAKSLVEASNETCWLTPRQTTTDLTVVRATATTIVAEFEQLHSRNGGVLLLAHPAGARYRVLVVDSQAVSAWLASEQTGSSLLEHLEGAVTALAERAAQVLELAVCAIDIVLTGSGEDTAVSIAAINPRAALPWPGEAASVAADRIVGALYPAGAPATVPIVVVSGGPKRVELANAIAEAITTAGLKIAVISDDGVRYDDNDIVDYGARATAVRTMLADRKIETLVVTCTTESIETTGLGVPHCSVAVVADATSPRIAAPGLANGLEVLLRTAQYSVVDDKVEPENPHCTCVVTTTAGATDCKPSLVESGNTLMLVGDGEMRQQRYNAEPTLVARADSGSTFSADKHAAMAMAVMLHLDLSGAPRGWDRQKKGSV